MFRSRRTRRRMKKLVIRIGIFVGALAVMGAIVTHTMESKDISKFMKNSADTEAFIRSVEDVYKTREAFVDYTMFTIKYLRAGEYSLEEKWLFLHHFKDVGGTYVASMRELGVSDKEIKEDLNQMLGQMLNASKNIKGQVIDLIPGFVCARSKWFQRLGLKGV